LHSLFSGKDRDLKIQRQRVLYRGLTYKQRIAINLLDLYSDSIIYMGTLSGAYYELCYLPIIKNSFALMLLLFNA